MQGAASSAQATQAGVRQWYRTPMLGDTALATLLHKVQKAIPGVTAVETEQCFNVELASNLSQDDCASLEW